MADEFHQRHGRLIYLSNNNRTARRRNPGVEFNNGLIFSQHRLKDNEIFEIRVDRRISSWSGSLAIGVTTANPCNIEIPACASGLKNGYWIMSGVTVIKDGITILENYGRDLDELTEGDRVGVSRLADGCLHFFVNGNDFGVACRDVPPSLHAVVDLYGKCVEVSTYKAFNAQAAQVTQIPSTASVVFHPHCGSLVKLCNNNRTAERQLPNEEFKNSVVLTNKPLQNDKLFEVRVEKLTEIWAGSLEVGVTTHDPVDIILPATMTMMPTGTWIWSAASIIVNGKEIKSDYSDISLEAIKIGDKVGIMRKSDSTLHFFLNGADLGVAASDIPEVVYGVVDLYGAAIKATVCGDDLPINTEDDANEASNVNAVNTSENDSVPLRYHPRCGMAVSFTNNYCTALRPRALEEFNYAVTLTNRPIKPGELFEVYVDRQVDKWAGSLEIGLTNHNPETLEFPSTMTNLSSGTWIMSGGGLVVNGSTTMEDYGNSLDDLKVGDRVGVKYSESGSLHFFVNGEDMGEAATNVPQGVYGMVDLYGRSAQATITNGRPREAIPECADVVESTARPANQEAESEQAENSAPPTAVTNENWFTLSARHGDQVAVSQDCRVALRINPLVEFNNAVVMSNRPLRDDEMFEVIVLTLVDRWSGSLEAGVTTTSPTNLSFPNTMTDLDHDTWMLSGSSVLQDGVTIQNGYACDLDKLKEGDRLGIMRKSDSTLHFFINEEDCGVAATSVPPDIYAIIDLYGRCVQLAIYDEDYISRTSTTEVTTAETQTVTADDDKDQACAPSSFHPCCGRNVTLSNKGWVAKRTKGFSDGLLFSAKPLQDDEIFEIKIDKVGAQWSGSLSVGVTSCLLPMSNVPSSADQLRDGTWLMVESRILKDGMTVKENYGPSLDRLQVGTRIGLQRKRDGTLHIYFNGEDQGVAAPDVPRMVFGLVDLYGVVESVSIVHQTDQRGPSPRNNIESDRALESKTSQTSEGNETAPKTRHRFTSNCGQHVRLDNKQMLARRVASYNHGVVLSDAPLADNELFQIRITKLDIRWSGSLMIGITDQDPESISLPSISNCMKICPWIVVNNAVYINGNKVFEGLQPGLDRLHVGDSVGLMIDKDSRLHIVINGQDQGAVAEALPAKRHVVVDLYGCCQEVSIVTPADQEHSSCEEKDENKTPKGLEDQKKGPCDYRQMCDRFRASLAIPDGYFNQDSKLNICYCQACHEARGEKQYEISGDPARRYAQPLGWCQFGLGLPPRIKALQVLEKWHVAFYGTQIGKIRRILDVGDLPMPDAGSGRRRTKSNSNKENEVPRLMISPTVMCVTCSKQAPAHQYRDVTTGKSYSAQVAFRVCVKPGSYSTGQASSCCADTNETLSDHNLGTQDLEWYLNEKELVVLTSLLIKIEPT